VVLVNVFGIAILGVEIMMRHILPILSVYTSSYPVILIIDCSQLMRRWLVWMYL
jgi:hypothetical protein